MTRSTRKVPLRVSARAAVAALEPYVCVNRAPVNGTMTRNLKLDWNESTMPPSPVVLRRLAEFLAKGHINWYGDPSAARLVKALAGYTGLCPSQVQVFNGSDSALDYVARTFVARNDHVVIAAPSYDNLRVLVEQQEARVEQVVGPNPFATNLAGLLDRIEPDTRLVYLCNPNNPTGVRYSPAQVERLLGELPRGILLVDEAYFEFTGVTVAPLVARYPNLVVTRTFSKAFGLAGVRCGYILGDQALIAQVNRIRNGKDVNVLAQLAALAALGDLPHMEAWVAEVRRSRSWLVRNLRARGYEVRPSPANFILVGVESPREFVERLRRRGVYIRDRSGMRGLSPYVRVTIGTRAESKRLLDAFDEIRAEGDPHAGGASSDSTSARRSARVQNSHGDVR